MPFRPRASLAAAASGRCRPEQSRGAAADTLGGGLGGSAARRSSATATPRADPVVTIAPEGAAELVEHRSGSRSAEFRVTLSKALASDLEVALTVSETSESRSLGPAVAGDFVAAADEGAKTVTATAGQTSAVYAVALERDAVFEQDAAVRATLAPGQRYHDLGSAASASVRVLDDDQPFLAQALDGNGRPVTASAAGPADIRVGEGDGQVALRAECVTRYDRPVRIEDTLTFSLTTRKITAEFKDDADYVSESEQLACNPGLDGSAFARVRRDGGWIYRSVVSLDVTITEDEVYDPGETFYVKMQGGNLPVSMTLVERPCAPCQNADDQPSNVASHLVTIVDNETAGVRPSLTALDAVEDAAAASYEIVLESDPGETVTVTPVSDDTSAVTVRGALIFTSGDNGNWDTPQTVTVTAVEDGDSVSERVTVSHTVSTASGGGYHGVSVADVTVRVEDNDSPGITRSVTQLELDEGGAPGSYTLVPRAQPSGTVTVQLTSSDTGAATVSPSSLTSRRWRPR